MEKIQKHEKTNRRNLNLDLIKLLSCLAVIMMHILYHVEGVASKALYQLSGFAVPCFFMASGFVLLNKEKIELRYCVKKICKVLRVVILWNVVMQILQLLQDIASQGVMWKTVATYGWVCIKNILKSLVQKGDLWQFWYLGALILIYALLPLLSGFLQITTKNRKRIVQSWCAVLIICVSLQIVSYIMGRPIQLLVIQTFRIWTWMQYFILGGIYRLYRSEIENALKQKYNGILLIILTSVMLAFRLTIGCNMLQISIAEYFYDDLLTVIWVFLLIVYIMRIELTENVCRWIGRLSPLTMGVYIIHPIVKNYAIQFIAPDNLVMGMCVFLLICVLSFAGTYAIRKLPFGKYLIEL